MKISPVNIFQKMLCFEKYYQNCQASFGRSKCEWVKVLIPFAKYILTYMHALVQVPLKTCRLDVFIWHLFENNLAMKHATAKYSTEKCCLLFH